MSGPSLTPRLEYWLSEELSRASPAGTPSRLRQLAAARRVRIAAWSAGSAAGTVFVATGIFAALMSGVAGWALVLDILGGALTVGGLLGRWRALTGLPDAGRPLIVRGPTSARRGTIMVVVLAVALGAGLAVPLTRDPGPEAATAVALVGAYALIVALLVACIVVPATIMERDRDAFRARATSDPRLAALLEQDLLDWERAPRVMPYGPL